MSKQKKNFKDNLTASCKKAMRPRLVLIIVAIIIFCLLVYFLGGSGLYTAPLGKADLPTLINESLQKTFNCPYYRFTNSSSLQIDEQTRIFSLLKGEVSQGQSHIEGSILGTPVNVYFSEGQFYQQDPIDGSWRITDKIDSDSAARLISEMDPQANFQFTTLGTIENLGTEKIDGKKTVKVQFKPTLQDQWIEKYFTDITYTLWIDRRHSYIVHSRITANGKDSASGLLTIENGFSDFNNKFELDIPAALAITP